MSYFRELPDLQYISVFKERNSNEEYTLAKNIFKRPKIREDLASSVTAFEYYHIIGDERPDQIAEKLYSNAELDWTILITNNITSYNDEWPLDHNSLYNYMISKYGSEEEIQKIHHYETIEYRDEFGRILINGGLQVDPEKLEVIETNTTDTEYQLGSFPQTSSNEFVSVNLNQKLNIFGRENEDPTNIFITNINNNQSLLKYLSRESTDYEDILIINTLNDWPNSWSGYTTIKLREQNDIQIIINDVILDNKVRITENLYEIIGQEVNNTLVPIIRLRREEP